MKRGGRAGAVGLPQGEGRVSESGCCAGSSHPPLLLGESVYPPPARLHHLIGYCCWENESLPLARVPNERNHCAGRRGRQGGGRWYGPPRGPAPQCLAPRPCATWQEARAGGGGGLRTQASGWWPPRLRPGPPPLKGETRPTCARHPWGWGKERGSVRLVCGREARGLQKSAGALQSGGSCSRGGGEKAAPFSAGGGECRNTFVGVLCRLLSSKDRLGPGRTALGLEESLSLPPPHSVISSSPPCRVACRLWAGFLARLKG